MLTLISQKPHYGYQMVTELGKWEQLAAPEGTFYPLLRRLQKDSYIAGRWEESASGPPRKYYHLTDSGEKLLFTISSEWTELTRSIEHLQRNGKEPHNSTAGECITPGKLIALVRVSAVADTNLLKRR